MPAQIHDPLMERMRRADPTREILMRADVDRGRTRSARRRRAARRGAALGSAAGFAALLATLTFALGPVGEHGRGSLILEAGKAAELPPSSIVVVDSVATFRYPQSSFSFRHVTVFRISATGRLLATRDFVRSASDPSLLRDLSFSYVRGRPVTTIYDPRTGRVQRANETFTSPSFFAIRVEQLLASARAGRTRARVSGPTTVGGRSAFRIRLSPPSRGTLRPRQELLIDAKTHRASVLSEDVTGTLRGKPYFSHSSQRVLSQRTLPDTPHNRRILNVRVPIPPG
jgi:hypothetical protein